MKKICFNQRTILNKGQSTQQACEKEGTNLTNSQSQTKSSFKEIMMQTNKILNVLKGDYIDSLRLVLGNKRLGKNESTRFEPFMEDNPPKRDF